MDENSRCGRAFLAGWGAIRREEAATAIFHHVHMAQCHLKLAQSKLILEIDLF